MIDPRLRDAPSGGSEFILVLSCPDRPGIVGAVGTLLAENGCNIVDSAQFCEAGGNTFMMRVVFESLDRERDAAALSTMFETIGRRFAMQWTIHSALHRPRVLIMASKQDHCLNDLLYRYRAGALKIAPVAIVSNHRDVEGLASSHGIPFFFLPVTGATKQAQEAALAKIVDDERIELVVLARYMQILSTEMCRKLAGKAINIHHSFLPGFKGARPYHQAFERGVKLIGATAHYVTSDLDEGPIIEQEVTRVDYKMTAEDLAELGSDIEAQVLARAVRYHIEHRVFVSGRKTIVFR